MIVTIAKIHTELIIQSGKDGAASTEVIRARAAAALGIDEHLVAEAIRVLDAAKKARAQASNQSNGQRSRP